MGSLNPKVEHMFVYYFYSYCMAKFGVTLHLIFELVPGWVISTYVNSVSRK